MSKFENGAPSGRRKMMLGGYITCGEPLAERRKSRKRVSPPPGVRDPATPVVRTLKLPVKRSHWCSHGAVDLDHLLNVDGVGIRPMDVLRRFENRLQQTPLDEISTCMTAESVDH
jgi:hypothetical protein